MSSLLHALLALLAQALIGLLTGNWWAGAAFGGAFYFGREVAQHESKMLLKFGGRATLFGDEGMPWFEGFKIFNWSADSKSDLVLPTVSVLFLALFMHFSLSDHISKLIGL